MRDAERYDEHYCVRRLINRIIRITCYYYIYCLKFIVRVEIFVWSCRARARCRRRTRIRSHYYLSYAKARRNTYTPVSIMVCFIFSTPVLRALRVSKRVTKISTFPRGRVFLRLQSAFGRFRPTHTNYYYARVVI